MNLSASAKEIHEIRLFVAASSKKSPLISRTKEEGCSLDDTFVKGISVARIRRKIRDPEGREDDEVVRILIYVRPHECLINLSVTRLKRERRFTTHRARIFPPFGRNAYASQDLIQTMIHPSRCSRSESSRAEAARQAREVGRRLREWFESRPYTGGVVPSTCNYRKLASFCRAVSCPPFLSFLLVSLVAL